VPVFSEPKTDSGRRVVPIDTTCAQALRDHLHQQKIARLAHGPVWAPYDLVFTVAGGGPISQSNLHKRFARFTAQAGLPRIRFHDLRHSHATLLLREGVPAKIVSERLGHASIALTLDTYSHVLPDMQEQAVSALELGLFGRVPSGPRGHSVDTA
jgi:integrase